MKDANGVDWTLPESSWLKWYECWWDGFVAGEGDSSVFEEDE